MVGATPVHCVKNAGGVGDTQGGQGHTNAWSGDESVHCVQVSRYTVPGTEHSAVCSMWHAMHT